MSRRHFLTIPILIFFLCMLSFPQTVFAGASYGLLLWFRHVLPTLLPYMVLINILIRTPALHWICHITVSMSAPWHFLLWHICSTHRLLMRISDGRQDSFRPSGRSENFAFGSLLPFVFLQQYKPCFHLKLCCHSESEKGFYFHSVSSYSYTYASYDELCLSSFLPRKRPYPSIFTLDAGFFFNCFTV